MILNIFTIKFLLTYLAYTVGIAIILIFGNKLLDYIVKRINVEAFIKNLQFIFFIIGIIWFGSFIFHKKTYAILIPETDNEQIQLVIKDYWGLKENSYVIEFDEYSWKYRDYSSGSLKLKTLPDKKGINYY